MVLELESRCPPGGLGTLRMIRESAEDERTRYCYPFKEYHDPTSSSNIPSNATTSTTTAAAANNRSYLNRMSHQSQNGGGGTVRGGGGTLSQASSSSAFRGLDKNSHLRSSRNELLYDNLPRAHLISENHPPSEPPPLPPRRSTSLFGGGGAGGATTLTLLRIPKPRESSTLNPKRISIATSSFWNGHPDLAHFASGWELGQNSMRSVWGTTERGGRPVTESVDIWGDPPAVKKGILIQQRDKMWSRWKERYFILTRDYLNCFRRTTSVHRSGVRLSEMGSFIYKLRLAEVDGVEWETRKSGSMIALILPTEPRILLRVPGENYEALHQWYTLLQECIYMSKERRQALRNQHGSMLRSTTSYNPNASKSTGSASPNSSSTKSSSSTSNNSKSASNSDLDRMGGIGGEDVNNKSLRRKVSNSISRSGSGLLSLRKISGGSSPSPRSFLRAQTTEHGSGKYSPLVDDDDDDDDDYETPGLVNQIRSRSSHANPTTTSRNIGINTNIGEKSAEDEFKVTLRRRRGEINNNNGGGAVNGGLPTSWRLSLSQPPEKFDDHHINTTEQKFHGITNGNNGINNSVRIKTQNPSSNNNGYATPHDARVRPESWTPQPTIFYRTSSLVPSQWMNPRDNVRQQVPTTNNGPPQIVGIGNGCGIANGYGSGRGHFNRASVYCPSRVTSDVSFRKNVK